MWKKLHDFENGILTDAYTVFGSFVNKNRLPLGFGHLMLNRFRLWVILTDGTGTATKWKT